MSITTSNRFFLILNLIFLGSLQSQTFEVRDDPIFIFSYPRSGNTWLRYCLENLIDYPSISYNILNGSEINSIANLPLVNSKNKKIGIIKSHWYFGIQDSLDKWQNISDPTIILLIRSPFEAIFRHTRVLNESNAEFYFDIIKDFDKSIITKKIVVYYEDLISNPKIFFTKLLRELNQTDEKLDLFLQNYEEHKKKCIILYEKYVAGSESKGKDLDYHKKNYPTIDLINFSKIIKQSYPKETKKYLQRYLKQEYSDLNLH